MTAGCTAGCSTSFTNSSSNSSNSSSSCNPCKVNCSAYALKCNTYKSMSGQILIPGPQGQPSTSLANFSGINSTPASSQIIYFPTVSYVNINPSTVFNLYDTFTFNLSGKYLFQYNVFIVQNVPNTIEFVGKVKGVSSTTFGSQNVLTTSSYGCSVIQDMIAGDYVSLTLASTGNTWNFASLTIIKL